MYVLTTFVLLLRTYSDPSQGFRLLQYLAFQSAMKVCSHILNRHKSLIRYMIYKCVGFFFSLTLPCYFLPSFPFQFGVCHPSPSHSQSSDHEVCVVLVC